MSNLAGCGAQCPVSLPEIKLLPQEPKVTQRLISKFAEFLYLVPLIFAAKGGSRTAATSKMERFVTIVNGLKP